MIRSRKEISSDILAEREKRGPFSRKDSAKPISIQSGSLARNKIRFLVNSGGKKKKREEDRNKGGKERERKPKRAEVEKRNSQRSMVDAFHSQRAGKRTPTGRRSSARKYSWPPLFSNGHGIDDDGTGSGSLDSDASVNH